MMTSTRFFLVVATLLAIQLATKSIASWQENLKPISYTTSTIALGQPITSMAVGLKNSIWATIADGSIWRWSEAQKKWEDMSTKIPAKVQTEISQIFDKGRANQPVYLRCKQVIAAPDGTIWAVGFNNKIYFWQE